MFSFNKVKFLIGKSSMKFHFIGWQPDYDQMLVSYLDTDFNCKLSNFSLFHRIVLALGSNKYFKNIVHIYHINMLRQIAKEVKVGDTVIINEHFSVLPILNMLENEVVLIFRNTIDVTEKRIIELKSRASLYSFDKQDCETYSINYLPQFLLFDPRFFNNEIEYDYYFLGLNKGREIKLKKLVSVLNKSGLSHNIVIKEIPDSLINRGISIFPFNSVFKKVSYLDNLKMLSKAKVVIELTKEGQSGLTLRAVEAKSLGLKILTNNESLEKYEGFDSGIYYNDFKSESSLKQTIEAMMEDGLHKGKVSKAFLDEYSVLESFKLIH
jgi:1,5-rhamnosyltransferase